MMNRAYSVYTPHNLCRNKTFTVNVPGSKSITNRALLIAAMAKGRSTLHGCLTSEDAEYFIRCLKDLGFHTEESPDGRLGSDITIAGAGGDIPNKKAEIYVGSAGTAARFLVAMLALSDGEYTVNSSEQMKKRPMEPLIDSLRSAGADVKCLEKEGYFPLHITGAKALGQTPCRFSVNIDKSSQFLSALLIAAGTLEKRAEIRVQGTHGLSYVDLTAKMMKTFGVQAEKKTCNNEIRYEFTGTDHYKATDYLVEPDMSAAAYFYAMAAVLGVSVCVEGVTENMLQGDTEFMELLVKMGCTSSLSPNSGYITVKGPENGKLKGGFTADMSAFSDQALTLAAIAPFADAPVTIKGIGHIRLQECDRINAISQNLRTLEIETEEHEDSITIYPGTPCAGDIETFDDHRVAMSFALTGLRTEGIRIINPDCCKKTFREYFDVLEKAVSEIENL